MPSGVAALHHEIVDHAVEDGVIVESLPGKEDQVVDRVGDLVGKELCTTMSPLSVLNVAV